MLAPTLLSRLPIRSRLPLSRPIQHHSQAATSIVPCHLRRTYATPGRPRNVVGEPSRPVKRSVKKAAATATSPDSPAKQANEERKAAAATAKQTRQPRANKELTAEEKEARAARAREARALRPKKVLTDAQKEAKATKATKARQPRPKTKLTDAQKESRAAKALSAKHQALKRAALSPPTITSSSAYNAFISQNFKDNKEAFGSELSGKAVDRATVRATMSKLMTTFAAAWKERTAAETEHYNHLGNEANQAALAEYKKWVESHTIEEIKAANIARRQLRGLRRKNLKEGTSSSSSSSSMAENKRGPKTWTSIVDERQVKRPTTSFSQFVVNRHASGDFKNIPTVDSMKLISQEWRTLSAEEKDKYVSLSYEDRERYKDEYSAVYGREAPHVTAGHESDAPAAVAAAAA
ncbi:hypothetical protein LTR62_000476 [Meristemomyces frigidus]|uniref:HMG box domain-containing protein n=1 Tax=Meristemomyces frigidus TaxID=1508187 RepID=A0AAN7TPG0_9PEZI|nr:hypothetical protein LTR62_000476 [Meristemomyces frigidus]